VAIAFIALLVQKLQRGLDLHFGSGNQ